MTKKFHIVLVLALSMFGAACSHAEQASTERASQGDCFGDIDIEGPLDHQLSFGDSFSGPVYLWDTPTPLELGNPPLFTRRLADRLRRNGSPGMKFDNYAIAGTRAVTSEKNAGISAQWANFIGSGADNIEPNARVLVTVTIGGNDLLDAFEDAFAQKDDDEIERVRTSLRAFLNGVYGRYPEAVVVLGNIPDVTGGTGTFAAACRQLSQLHKELDPKLWWDRLIEALRDSTPDQRPEVPGGMARWNAIYTDLQTEFSLQGRAIAVADVYTAFQGHGIYSSDTYLALPDCIHPNHDGHEVFASQFEDAVKQFVHAGAVH